MNSNQLQLLHQKLSDLISNKITVSGNTITVNGKSLTFDNSTVSKVISTQTTVSR